jgi:hypothetical protein
MHEWLPTIIAVGLGAPIGYKLNLGGIMTGLLCLGIHGLVVFIGGK